VLAPELEVGAGYDDNLFLNPDLATAPSGPVADAILHVATRLPASLRLGGHQLLLSYDLEWHQPLSGDFGSLVDQLMGLEYRSPELDTPLSPMVLHVGGIAERYDATFTSAPTGLAAVAGRTNYDAFWLYGVQAGLDLVGRAGRGGVAYRYAEREYSERVQSDDEQRVLLYYENRPLPLVAAGMVYTFTHIDSSLDGAPDLLDGVSRHRLALMVRLGGADLGVRIEPALVTQTLPRFVDAEMRPVERHDVQFAIFIYASLRMSEHVDLFGRFEHVSASSDDQEGSGTFSRNQLVLGLSGHFLARTGSAVVAPPEAFPPLVDSIAPTVVAPGQVRFRLRAPGARAVSVVGEWNGWDPAQSPLLEVPGDPGLFEAVVALPPGRVRFSFLVDGEPRRPPSAEAYVSDGFGGENGVVEVTP
jgi:hypothetical protein